MIYFEPITKQVMLLPSGIGRSLFFKTSQQQIVNTTTPTEVIVGLNVGSSYSLAENSIGTNQLYEMEILGSFSSPTIASAPVYQFAIGGSNVNTSEINNLSAGTTNKNFFIKAHFYFTAIGGSGSVVFTCMEINGNSITSLAQSGGKQLAMPVTINTTIANLISCKMSWSTAVSASNIITISSATLNKIVY